MPEDGGEDRTAHEKEPITVRASIRGRGLERRVRKGLREAARDAASAMLAMSARQGRHPRGVLFGMTVIAWMLAVFGGARLLGVQGENTAVLLLAVQLASFASWVVAALLPVRTVPREAQVTVLPDAVRLAFEDGDSLHLPLLSIAEWELTGDADSPLGRDFAIALRTGAGAVIHVDTTLPEARALDEALRHAHGRVQAGREALERRGRCLQEWRAALRAASREHGYRGAPPPLPHAVLSRLVDDPDADQEQRIGAALALASDADAGTRERLRVASEYTENVKLRVALSTIADEQATDEAIEDAIAAARDRRGK